MPGVVWGPGGPVVQPGRTGDVVRFVRPAQLERQPDPIRDLVADLVRRFDPGGYSLQCPVAGCGWHLHVPRMELDPEPVELDLEGFDHYAVHAEGVPREDVELVLSAHVHWHAAMTETATPGMEWTWTPAVQPPRWEQQEWCDGGTCEHPRCLDELQRATQDDTP